MSVSSISSSLFGSLQAKQSSKITSASTIFSLGNAADLARKQAAANAVTSPVRLARITKDTVSLSEKAQSLIAVKTPPSTTEPVGNGDADPSSSTATDTTKTDVTIKTAIRIKAPIHTGGPIIIKDDLPGGGDQLIHAGPVITNAPEIFVAGSPGNGATTSPIKIAPQDGQPIHYDTGLPPVQSPIRDEDQPILLTPSDGSQEAEIQPIKVGPGQFPADPTTQKTPIQPIKVGPGQFPDQPIADQPIILVADPSPQPIKSPTGIIADHGPVAPPVTSFTGTDPVTPVTDDADTSKEAIFIKVPPTVTSASETIKFTAKTDYYAAIARKTAIEQPISLYPTNELA